MKHFLYTSLILIVCSIRVNGQGSTIIYSTNFNLEDTLAWGERTHFMKDTSSVLVKRGWFIGNWPTPTSGTGPNVAQSGDYFAYFEHSCGFLPCSDTTLAMISPEILLDGIGSKLSFWYLLYGKSRTNLDTIPSVLTVSILSGPNMSIKDTIFGPFDNGIHSDGSFSSWQLASDIDISNYDGQSIRIEFMGTEGSPTLLSMGDMGIDNLYVTVDAVSNPIPTLGDWTSFILFAVLVIFSLIAIREKRLIDLSE